MGVKAGALLLLAGVAGMAVGQGRTTAWDGTGFRFDVPRVVARSNVVLERPNERATEAMPLGNGRLGAAVWAAEGMTVQLNRADTMPHRLSPGQVVIPGLKAMTGAADFHGELRLYDGSLVESGGGMSAKVSVDAAQDALLIEVTGADPKVEQTALLRLWEPRRPEAKVSGGVGWLAESWIDEGEPGASGKQFGSLAGISARGRSVRVEVTDERTVTLHALPTAAGRVTFVVAAPHFSRDGAGDGAEAAVRAAMRGVVPGSQAAWWHAFWARAGLIEVHSADGVGEYMENLRELYLFVAAAEGKADPPGSQAGIADLISSAKDVHLWDPAAFWHWNLRMQVAANLKAGLPELNLPYFRLYESNLEAMTAWTRERMADRRGVCVPETMRFNGNGVEYEVDRKTGAVTTGMNCDGTSKPYYNARTISTGAEVSLWAWEQYLVTDDKELLRRMYPVMRAATTFLLAYETDGRDGLRHTVRSNAHETQWDVTDPTTDLSARKTLYPVMIEAATTLGLDAELVTRLRDEVKRIPAFPRSAAGQQTAVTGESRTDVLADSWMQGATRHNVENLGLEPVWPYGLIGLGSAPEQLDLARRTYASRPFPTNQDWSYDPLQAARLGMGDEVAATLRKLTETYQSFPNGMANWGGDAGEFYVEQSGVVAAALAEAVVQDYDGAVRVAPAVPKGWSMAARVAARHGTKVDAEVQDGAVVSVAVEAGPRVHEVRVVNPWREAEVEILPAGGKGTRMSGAMLRVAVAPGKTYLLRPAGAEKMAFAAVSGERARAPRELGRVMIGLKKR